MSVPTKTATSVSELPSRRSPSTAGFTIVGEYYDAAVSGADRIDQRPGFAEMLQRLATERRKDHHCGVARSVRP